ncbi:MAG: hypothetical protein ACLRZZ_28475 [Enterocloster sp.]
MQRRKPNRSRWQSRTKDTATKVIKGAGTVLKAVGRPVTAVLKAKDTAFKVVEKDSRCIGPSGKEGGVPRH